MSPADFDGPVMDVCGTGGDRLDLFNISTTSMFVLAACGVVVAKHGNRGVSSKSGAADVLEVLGVPIQNGPEETVESLKRNGAAFMLAPIFHPAFKAIGPVRKRLAEQGVTTIFNVLGPLLNPVQPAYQLMGLFDASKAAHVAEVLEKLGRKRAWVVHGRVEDSAAGMDEVSILGSTDVHEASSEGVRFFSLNTQKHPAAALAGLRGGAPEENARILVSIRDGSERGAKRDTVVANAAAALLVAGVEEELDEALARASEAIDAGKALERLRRMQTV